MIKVILNSVILFSILYSESLTITAPNGNETIYKNDDYLITWITEGDVSPVDLSWSNDGGSSWTAFNQAIVNTEGTGSYTWGIPSTLGSSANYQIKIFDRADADPFDVSDAAFTIETYQITCSDIYEPNEESSTAKAITVGLTYRSE